MPDSAGFPLRLVADHHRRTGIWRGRRGIGQESSSGTLVAGARLFTDGSVRLADGAGDDARLGALFCERALRLVSRRFDGDIHLAEVAQGLSNTETRIVFATGHERLVDFDGQRLWLSIDVASLHGITLESGKNDLSVVVPEQLRGLELAFALSLFAQLDIIAGATLRSALHWT